VGWDGLTILVDAAEDHVVGRNRAQVPAEVGSKLRER
jgi:hypothetical protein